MSYSCRKQDEMLTFNVLFDGRLEQFWTLTLPNEEKESKESLSMGSGSGQPRRYGKEFLAKWANLKDRK